MHTIARNARGLRLLALLNADRLLMSLALGSALVLAAYLAQSF